LTAPANSPPICLMKCLFGHYCSAPPPREIGLRNKLAPKMLSHYVSDMTVRTALRVIFDPKRLLTMLDISNIAWLYARYIQHSDMSPLQRNQSYARQQQATPCNGHRPWLVPGIREAQKNHTRLLTLRSLFSICSRMQKHLTHRLRIS
jgi:hypothetical protein